MLLRLLCKHRFYICNLDCKYNDPALHNHMNNPDRRYLLRIHTLDLPCRGDLIPSFNMFSNISEWGYQVICKTISFAVL